jgi:hypothetical protein
MGTPADLVGASMPNPLSRVPNLAMILGMDESDKHEMQLVA